MRYGRCLGAVFIMCLLLNVRSVFAESYQASQNLTTRDTAVVEINLNADFPTLAPLMITSEVTTMMGLRHAHVQLQERDFSCGAASLTSIFKFYVDYQTTELDVIQGLLALAKERGTLQKIIERRGFTMLDLKKYAESKGFKTSAFKLEFDDLVDLGEPALVPIIPGGYKHFVVFRGADDKYVYLADPSFGNLTETIDEFKHDWYGFTNVALIVHRRDDQPKDVVPPLVVRQTERFDPQQPIDYFLDKERDYFTDAAALHAPLVNNEW